MACCQLEKRLIDPTLGHSSALTKVSQAFSWNRAHRHSQLMFTSRNRLVCNVLQAVDQLVQGLTEDKYKGKMICVLAGYPQEIDDLMDANPGLASRFPETLHFPNFGVDDCCHLLKAGLKRKFSTEITSEAMVMLPRLLTPLVQVGFT